MINILKDQRVFLNYGPIQMVLDILKEDTPQPELACKVIEYVLKQFEKSLEYIQEIKGSKVCSNDIESFPLVVQKMIKAVKKSKDDSLTPLAAVAGSFSDIALQKAIDLGATRVIINNGGDIALKDVYGRPFTVGIPIDKENPNKHIKIKVDNTKNTVGICTSGVGGRSFTKGIATAAVVLADNAAIADACATSVGNKTNVEDDCIIRCMAEKIDSGTDIPGHQITVKVGNLSKEKIYKALYNGLKAAESLFKDDIIKGAFLCVKSEMVTVPDNITYSKL